MPPVEVLLRRAKTAGIGGWITVAVGVLGLLFLPHHRTIWIVVGFAGLGGVLVGLVLLAVALRRVRSGS